MVDISSGDKKINITVSTSGNKASVKATPDTAMYYSNKSREWAISDKIVSNEDYSSKYYANISKQNADKSTATFENLTTNYNQYKTDLENTKNISVEEIETAKTNAISDITNQENISVDNVNTAGATQVNLAKEQATIATEQAEIATAKASEVVENGDVALSNISNAKTEALTDIGNLKDTSISTITSTKTEALTAITTQETTSKNNVKTKSAEQIALIQNEGATQVANVQSTGFYMRDDKLYFINSQGAETEFKSGGASIPYGTEIALASTIDYVPVGFLPTDGTEYNASDFQKFWDDYLVYDVWTAQTVGSKGYYDITYGNGRFVAVGAYGLIATSTDGVNWSTQTVGSEDYYDITYANNRFVAVGGSSSGLIATSTDGVNWSTQTVGSGYYYHAITYGNGTFVAVGSTGKVAMSTDTHGTTWQVMTTDSSASYRTIAYGNNIFVAGGFSGKTVTVRGYENYTTQIVGEANTIQEIIYANDKFVAVNGSGQILFSKSGTSWTIQNIGSTAYEAITYANNRYVAVGGSSSGGQISTSTDSVNWTTQYIGSKYQAVVYANDKFVAVGADGLIATSTDGTSWATQTVGSKLHHAITYANNRYVAVGDYGQISTSETIYQIASPLLSSLSYADYATAISTYGQCSKFGLDGTNNKFKVPTKYDNVYRYYVYAKEDSRTVEEWTAYIESLGGNTKANSSYSLDYAPRIIQTHQSGCSGYIVWSNGYCEQWGYNTTASKTAKITLTKTYKDKYYNITDALGGPDSGTATISNYANLYRPNSASSFTIYKYDTNAARYCYWRTTGFLASGQY